MPSVFDALVVQSPHDFVRILEGHRRDCEQSMDYEAAELTRSRLRRLKQRTQEKLAEKMAYRHAREKEAVLRRRDKEVQKDRESCAGRAGGGTADGLQEMVQRQAQLAERQAMELQKFNAQTVVDSSVKPKWSSLLRDMLRKVECLGKQGRYAEARKLKRQIDEQKEQEASGVLGAQEEHNSQKTRQFLERQERERQVLQTKIVQKTRQTLRDHKRADFLMAKRWHNQLQALEEEQSVEKRKAHLIFSPVTPMSATGTPRRGGR